MDNLPYRLEQLPVTVELSREDGIGYVTLTHKTYELLSFELVAQLATTLRGSTTDVVHFHRLEGNCVMFFVFDTDQGRRKVADYGTPVSEWLAALGGWSSRRG